MTTYGEKITFGFLGALTAIILGLSIFSDLQKQMERNPASQQEQIEFHPYEYFID